MKTAQTPKIKPIHAEKNTMFFPTDKIFAGPFGSKG
jgi:hypothetical protein